jgi:hypothetical protein
MESIDDKIVAKVKKCGRGNVFLSSDFWHTFTLNVCQNIYFVW